MRLTHNRGHSCAHDGEALWRLLVVKKVVMKKEGLGGEGFEDSRFKNVSIECTVVLEVAFEPFLFPAWR